MPLPAPDRGETVPDQPGDRIVESDPVVIRQHHPLVHTTDLPLVLSTTPTLLTLLQALRRRWRLAFFLSVFCSGAVFAGVWFSQTETYTVRTTVHVPVNPHVVMNHIPEGRPDIFSFQRTQMAILKSRLVLNAALNDPRLKDVKPVKDEFDPVLWLERQIYADFGIAPEILRISMSGPNFKEMIAIVDAVRDCYLRELKGKDGGWREERYQLLKKLWNDADKSLQEKRRSLKSMAQEADAGTIKNAKAMEANQANVAKAIDRIDEELLQTQIKLRQATMEMEINAPDAKIEEVPLTQQDIDKAIARNPDVVRLETEVDEYEKQIERLKDTLREPEKEPKFISATKNRAAALKKLDARRESLREEIAEKAIETANDDRASAAKRSKVEMNHLKKKSEWLENALKERRKDFSGTTKKHLDIEWLNDEIALEEDLARRMATQWKSLEIEMKAPERFLKLEDAHHMADQDARLKKAGMAGGGTCAFILFAIALLEFRSRRISDVDEVVRGLKMRFVGSLPSLPSKSRGNKRGDARWQNQMNESIEATRTVLLHAAQAQTLKLIVVTSAVGGEGKTLTASHLAASLARAGRKTLLIDADLRRPALQKLFSLVTYPGFGELLRGEAELGTVVQAGPIPGLSIIAAGVNDDRSIQALSQPVLREIFDRCRQDYDFVIVDSAPILPIADSQVICQQVDGVIFAILQDVSRLPQVYAAHERLQALRVRIIGAVVNGTDGPVYGSTYPYGRGAGS